MRNPEFRFWPRVEFTDTCWLWTGYLKPEGYGQFTYASKIGYAHRFAYELFNGPIPKGLHLDHLCRVRRCVNPAHLEAVTPGTNVLRGEGWAAVHARQTECSRGHELNDANTYRWNGQRHCKECRKLYMRRYIPRSTFSRFPEATIITTNG